MTLRARAPYPRPVREPPAAPPLTDPRQLKKLMRRISLGVAVAGFGYLYWRFSIVRPDPRVTSEPYDRSVCVLDHRWTWGRDLEQGDLIYYRFAGEDVDRPVEVMGLPGDTVVVDGREVTVGDRRWPGGAGPKLEGVRTVPEGMILVINHAVSATAADSRSQGPVRLDGVTARIVMAWPIGSGE